MSKLTITSTSNNIHTASAFASPQSSLTTRARPLLLASFAAVSVGAALLYRYYTASRPSLPPYLSLPSSSPPSHRRFLRHWHSRGVLLSSPSSFFSKLALLTSHGSSHLQLIADFDHTLTAFRSSVTGERLTSSHGVLETSRFLPASYRQQAEQLNAKYYPIEIDGSIAPEMRARAMMEWWSRAHDLLISFKAKQSFIVESVKDAVAANRLALRSDMQQVFVRLHMHHIPLLIFSAGLHDVIEEFLRQQQLLHMSAVEVVSNKMRFDAEGVLVGFDEDIIHSGNKNYGHVHAANKRAKEEAAQKKQQEGRQQRQTGAGAGVGEGEGEGEGEGAGEKPDSDSDSDSDSPPPESELIRRKNVILLGDNLSDVQMSVGLEGIETLLRIGFLNDRVEARLEQYLKAYDVVILNDGSAEFVDQLIATICGEKQDE